MGQEQELRNSLRAIDEFIPRKINNVNNINVAIANNDAFIKEGSIRVLNPAEKKIIIVGEMKRKLITNTVVLATIYKDTIFLHSLVVEDLMRKIAQKFYLTISR
jgi:hypothetical protein